MSNLNFARDARNIQVQTINYANMLALSFPKNKKNIGCLVMGQLFGGLPAGLSGRSRKFPRPVTQGHGDARTCPPNN